MKNKILVSEDSPAKASLIRRELLKCGVSDSDVVVACSGAETRVALKDYAGQFSLLLLDLALPNRVGDTPSPSIGMELLKQILEDGVYASPTHIVGTTADFETLVSYEAGFRTYTTQILMVSPDASEWKFSLQMLIKKLMRDIEVKKDHLVDVCFITALRYPELSAVQELPIAWSPEQALGNGVLFQEGTSKLGGMERSFICAHSTQMGMVAASFMVSALIERFSPRVIIMTGICGGLEGASLGDVIVADKSWDWQCGKWLHDGDFEAAPDQKDASPELLGLARGVDATAHQFWRAQDNRPKTLPSVRIGPMLSGSAVVQDKDKHKLFLLQHRKATGVDMECYGVYFAAQMAKEPRPKVLCIKAVSDLADRHKDDNFQVFGSQISAIVAFDVVTRYFS